MEKERRGGSGEVEWRVWLEVDRRATRDRREDAEDDAVLDDGQGVGLTGPHAVVIAGHELDDRRVRAELDGDPAFDDVDGLVAGVHDPLAPRAGLAAEDRRAHVAAIPAGHDRPIRLATPTDVGEWLGEVHLAFAYDFHLAPPCYATTRCRDRRHYSTDGILSIAAG